MMPEQEQDWGCYNCRELQRAECTGMARTIEQFTGLYCMALDMALEDVDENICDGKKWRGWV